MKSIIKKLTRSWYLIVIAGLLACQAAVFLLLGDHSYIAVHDNLDLFVAHLKVMKLSGSFFTHGDMLPLLGGISRDNFGSELSLYNLLYFFLPSYYAYIAGYFLSIGISMGSCCLLAKDVFGEKYVKYRPLALVFGLIYGILPVFPAYSFAFASIPLAVYLVRKLCEKPSLKWYVLLFLYPVLSYFSYFGFFLLAYLTCWFVITWIRDRKPDLRLLSAIPVLFLGYAAFEYRLFYTMLFDDTVTIRSSMVIASMNLKEILATAWDGFANSMFHAGDGHTYFVLPVCAVYAVYLNARYLWKKQWKATACDLYNLVFLFIVFNSLIYGFYYFEPLRKLVETICPPLEGFQFNRTIFFNPFLWYLLLFILVKRLYDQKNKLLPAAGDAVAFLALLFAVLTPAVFNDFYNTCYYEAYKLIKNKDVDMPNFHEYYSENLFRTLKEGIQYNGEYCAAFGLDPSILQFNGIATLDGYLGFYSQEYKEDFREMIAPALEKSDIWTQYFDNWGARAFIPAGTDETAWLPSKGLTLSDPSLYIDPEAFKEMGGTYILSRFELPNAEELNLTLLRTDQADDSPYTIYTYRAD